MRYRSNGKLLLTGEYLVLDGAKALALPTVKGQVLKVNPSLEKHIQWDAYTLNQEKWLSITFSFTNGELSILESNNQEQAAWVKKVLEEIHALNPSVLKPGLLFESFLEFERDWGLGSSSTFLSNLAQWAAVDPYALLWNTSKGSGYDIACGTALQPVFYQVEDRNPHIEKVDLNFPFVDDLFFVHLGLKQSSQTAIEFYNQKRSRKKKIQAAIERVNEMSAMIPFTSTLSDFEELLREHESILAELLNMERVQDALFESYPGVVKSLGAWGGDFVLATGADENRAYFENYGLTTIIPFEELIMHA